MTIRTSSAREVEALLQQLRSPVAVERDAAVARLRVIGARARDKVLPIISDKSTTQDARVAALAVIDALDDARAKRAAIAAAADADPAVAVAAIQVLRSCLSRDDDATALEAISAIVTDDTRRTDVRRAALDALSELPASLTQPLTQTVAAQLASSPPLNDAAAASEWLVSHEDAPLGMLHDLLSHARDHQRDAANDRAEGSWLALRAAAHAVFARRASRVALYDARDMFEQARAPLPLDLLVTMRTIGDMSCLDALARSWESIAGDAWWRGQVQEAAAAIIKREKATGRNAIIKRVRSKWPGFLPSSH